MDQPVRIGQDATGRWAWMILTPRGRCFASRDNYDTVEHALADLLDSYEAYKAARDRGELL